MADVFASRINQDGGFAAPGKPFRIFGIDPATPANVGRDRGIHNTFEGVLRDDFLKFLVNNFQRRFQTYFQFEKSRLALTRKT